METFEGVYPVVSTPFDGDGEVDVQGLRSIVRAQVDWGVDGVVLFGIAAEFYKLTDEERREIVRVAAAAVDGTDTALVVSVTDHATRLAVEFATFAEEAGADGLMLLPPFFLGPSEADLLAHATRVGEAVSVPVMVQYAPEQTGVTIDPGRLAALAADVGTVRAVKVESQPPGPYVSRLLDAAAEAGADVDALVGYAGLQMIEAMDRGAVGVIPGAALSPVYREIYEAHREGRREEAVARHAELVPLLSFAVQGIEQFIHYEKRLLVDRGLIDSPRCRAPAFEPDDAFDRRFRECYAAVVDSLPDVGPSSPD